MPEPTEVANLKTPSDVQLLTTQPPNEVEVGNNHSSYIVETSSSSPTTARPSPQIPTPSSASEHRIFLLTLSATFITLIFLINL